MRTVYRDLEALESELHVPIWSKGKKRGVVEGYHLPPVPFTLPEAMNIALAARLMQSHSRWYDPHRSSTLMKLNSVVPPPLRKQMQVIIDWMEKQPRNKKQIEVSEKLADAWLSQHQATIQYRESDKKVPQEILIEPYFIEPATPGNSGFVIAYNNSKKTICIYKISCIERVKIGVKTYNIPDDFDATKYLSSAWGVFAEEPSETVKLHFKPHLSRPISEAIWSPSQVIEVQKDGSSIMTLMVSNNADFRAWVLGWGNEVEVLEPETLRNHIIKINELTNRIYHPESEGNR